MVREVITVSIGECGVQLGHTVWKQYCKEHKILKDGSSNDNDDDAAFQSFFKENSNGKYIPLNLSIDSEPNIIDDIKNSQYASMFDDEYLISGKQDAGNIFARGYIGIGNNMIYKIKDRLRKLADKCDNIQGFVINHSVAGGTGSGLGCRLLETMALDYPRKTILGNEVYPSSHKSKCIVDPYNALLTTHCLLDHTTLSIVFDNEAIYNICQRRLDIKQPSYDNFNRLTAKVISSITAELRYESAFYADMAEYQGPHYIPEPRLHFMITSMSPLLNPCIYHSRISRTDVITEDCFKPRNFFVKIDDFDAQEDKYLSISLNYRGNVKTKDANACTQWLKKNRKVTLVDWCPIGIKVRFNENPMTVIDKHDRILPLNRHACMMGNNTGISRFFSERITKKYDLMYHKQAYIHWYIRENMELDEFQDARENLEFMFHDYLDALSYHEQTNDCNDTSNEDDDNEY